MFQDKSLKSLMNNYAKSGVVEWIGVRKEIGEDLEELDQVNVSIEKGLERDHYHGTNKKRQVTLIQKEHIAAVSAMMGREELNPQLLRRNLVISGLNLLALKDKRFRIGTVVLEMTGLCHPCSRMEKNLGNGGYNAMRSHGGITARVLEDGEIKKGDKLEVLEN
ncbi:MAG: MOSC domain-containing protein YiiM [Algoriphagus sp.]|jgi:MOSC domain-containing protein YiiM